MSKQSPSDAYPLPLEPIRFCRNGRAPLALIGQRILSGYNHVMGYRRKTFFTKGLHLATLPAGAAGTLVPWRTYIRTGYAATGDLQLYFQTIAAPADSATAEPTITWKTGSGLATSAFSQGVNTGSLGMGDLRVGYGLMEVAANTAYEVYMETTDYARPVSATIWELHNREFESGDTGIVQRELISAGEGITDTQHNQLLQSGHDLWKGNAAPVAAWCTDEDPDNSGTAPQRSTASYANLFDQTVTSVTAGSPGIKPSVQYHNPYHSSNVECIFAVYAQNAVATGGDVRLLDANGTIATVSSFNTTGEWKTATANLDGSINLHKADIHFQGDGSNNLTVHAFALYEYAS